MRLKIENLSVTRGGMDVISKFNHELCAGEAMLVTGENGAGKSTLLRAISGLLPLQSGKVILTDDTGKDFENPVREYCHYLGHQNAMKSALTVHENLKFWQDFMGEHHLSVEEALDEVELLHVLEAPYSYLSSGQKRRVSIARLLVSDRPIWILDEPTSGLDARSVEVFSSLANAFCNDGGILVAATHLQLGLVDAKTVNIGEAKP